MFSIANSTNQNKLLKPAIRDLKIGAMLLFIGVNLYLAVGSILHGLIYFDFLQSGNHEHRYEVHVPNLPDMCSDVIMALVFSFAYLFITSDSVKNVVNRATGSSSEINDQDVRAVRQLIDWAKKLFFISIIGFSLYFFSKYFLSIGIETFLEEEHEEFHYIHIPFILNTLNCIMRLCSILIFATVYSRYLSLNRAVTATLYGFFFVQFLFASNVLGFITRYDLYIGASILDFLTPLIIVYSLIDIFIGL